MATQAIGSRRRPIMLANLLLFGLFRRPQNAADIIHRAYVFYYWRLCRTFRSRLFVLWNFLISPIAIGKEIVRWTIKMGKVAASCSGKSIPRQIMEQGYLGFCYSIDSENYYLQEFYRSDGLKRARFFVNKGALKYGIYSQLGLYGRLMSQKLEVCSLGEKVLFSKFCRRKEIPVVPILMEFKADGSIIDYREAAERRKELPEQDLFCKPNVDKEGEGAEAWYWTGNNNIFMDTAGNTLKIKDLKERLTKLARSHISDSYIIQPLIFPHHVLEPFRKQATPTVRIITYIDTDGLIKTDRAMLRFSRNSQAIVDNASAGGMVAPINTSTGMLGSATESGPECMKNRWKVHYDNGEQIEGRLLPFWTQTCALALRAHQHFLHRLVIGWDIIITPEGPVILEGNGQPGLCFLQKAHLTPLGMMDLGNALAAQSQKAFKYLYSGMIGDPQKNDDLLDLYKRSDWLRRLGWLRLNYRQAVRLVISGKVQGVFYRKWLQRKATLYKVNGWARNCPDGTVETVLSGKAPDIEDLAKQCWIGPGAARVESIKGEWYWKPVGRGFQIVRGERSE